MRKKINKELDIKTGGQSFWVRIASWSMAPLIKKGDRLLIRKVDPGTLKPGEIICFKKGNILVTHRIYSMNKRPKKGPFFVIKPDLKDKLDLPVSSKDILGKAVVLQRRAKDFDLNKKIFRLWGMILIISYRIHPVIPVFINELTLKILKTGVARGVFKRL